MRRRIASDENACRVESKAAIPGLRWYVEPAARCRIAVSPVLRARREGRGLATGLKDLDAARASSWTRSVSRQEIYVYKAQLPDGGILPSPSNLAQNDPQKVYAMTNSEPTDILPKFLNHPGANQIYRGQRQERLTAHKRLKKFDQIEQNRPVNWARDNLSLPRRSSRSTPRGRYRISDGRDPVWPR